MEVLLYISLCVINLCLVLVYNLELQKTEFYDTLKIGNFEALVFVLSGAIGTVMVLLLSHQTYNTIKE